MKRQKLILEFTEFNSMRLNPDSSQMSVHVDNPQLSINAFDRHEDAIRAGMSRINSILHTLSNSATFKSLKSRIGLEDQKITSIKIQRLSKESDLKYNVYLSFVIDDQEYYGVIEDLLSRQPNFKSEVFKNFDLVQTKEWVIRTKGLVIKTIKTWLKPDPGKYRLINNEILCYSVNTGKMLKGERGIEVEVIRALDDKIVIKHGNDYYNLVNDNFVYFNYWFEKLIPNA